mmetsp:Transcript_7578/g.19436  ORF Transcript_7578/g.19436 Transcript_7578/m.19436 type:complete len:376 (+) Transcript_7578:94-1221(+)
MHGRKREPKELKHDKARIQARQRKAKLYAELSSEVMKRRREKRFDEESLTLAAKLLEMNCELYSLWNYRKEFLDPILKRDGDAAEGKELAQQELKLIQTALQKNPKSYCTWQHRKWIVAHKHLVDLEDELRLCDLLLTVDDRNFHCWSYRRYVVKLMDRDPEKELDFTTEKILQNFSNYSAWHYRSALLPVVHKTIRFEDLLEQSSSSKPKPAGEPKPKGPADDVPVWVLEEEFQWVKEAFYTEPEDQSAWLYHRWLTSHMLRDGKRGASSPVAQDPSSSPPPPESSPVVQFLDGEVQMCREILEVEPGSKWPMLTLARLLHLRAEHGDGIAARENQALLEEGKTILRTLMGSDEMRKGYYGDAVSKGGGGVVPV